MGAINNIGFGIYPKQSDDLGKRVIVIYNYDKTKMDFGRIIRDDIEDPSKTIIKLDDDRILLSTECQYSLVD
jgi:hypothetical protein